MLGSQGKVRPAQRCEGHLQSRKLLPLRRGHDMVARRLQLTLRAVLVAANASAGGCKWRATATKLGANT